MTDSNVNPQNDLLDSLLSDFLDESDELLTQLNRKLLQLDEWVQSLDDCESARCDAELLNEMFRAAHSLKGLSAMFGLTDINTLTHKIENVFDAARRDQLALTPDVTELMFMGVDHLTALIELVKDPQRDPVEPTIVLDRIGEVLRGAGVERQQKNQKDVERLWDDGGAPAPVPEVPNPFAELRDEEELSEKYVVIFVDETEVALDELNETLLSLEGGGNPEQLKSLLVVSHRIKGSAASIGLNRAAKLAHLMEDQLQVLVDNRGTLSTDLTDAMLGCTDALRQFVGRLRNGERGEDQFAVAARRLIIETPNGHPVAGGGDVGHPTTESTKTLEGRLNQVVNEIFRRLEGAELDTVSAGTGIALDILADVLRTQNPDVVALQRLAAHFDRPVPTATAQEPVGSSTFAGEVRFENTLPHAGMKARLIFEKLQKMGEVDESHPPAEQLEELTDLSVYRFRIRSTQNSEHIVQQIRVAGVVEVVLQPVVAQMDDTSVSADPDAPGDVSEPSVSASSDAQPAAQGDSPTPEAPQSRQTTGGGRARGAAADADSGSASASTNSETKQRGGDGAARPAETLRVGIDRLDTLMNLAGQLVITKAQFTQIGEKLKEALAGNRSLANLNRVLVELDKLSQGDASFRLDGQHAQAQLRMFHAQAKRIQGDLAAMGNELQLAATARDAVKELMETIHQLNRVSDGIQQAVMDTRMVPIGPMFARFNRVVRDIARASGKEIRLNIRGEKTELDKRMIDELSDPLIHMVRNSADHGIESPDVRKGAGKPAEGTVTLEAFHRGNSIVIRVSDDGKGLDTGAIIRKCIKNGILTQSDAEKMSPQEIYQLIWMPGMSTAEKVTDVSGRGMGMDIVKSKIDALNGTVDIDSTPGRGTTMTIRLPVTLAILPSLMVQIGACTFALPMESVAEIVSSRQHTRSSVHGKDVVVVRGRPISLVRLRELLRFHVPLDMGVGGSVGADGDDREGNLVIVGETGRGIGLAVDRVLGEEDVVIKSIAENYRNVPGIAGASILGSGRVALILDVPALIDMASSNAAPVTT